MQPTSAQFSLTLRVRIDHRPGMLGRVATAIGRAGGTIGDIEEAMKMAAAEGIAAIVGDDELREDYVIPSAFNRSVAPAVAGAVAREARRTGWAEAGEGEFGYAKGDTGEFRTVPS